MGNRDIVELTLDLLSNHEDGLVGLQLALLRLVDDLASASSRKRELLGKNEVAGWSPIRRGVAGSLTSKAQLQCHLSDSRIDGRATDDAESC